PDGWKVVCFAQEYYHCIATGYSQVVTHQDLLLLEKAHPYVISVFVDPDYEENRSGLVVRVASNNLVFRLRVASSGSGVLLAKQIAVVPIDLDDLSRRKPDLVKRDPISREVFNALEKMPRADDYATVNDVCCSIQNLHLEKYPNDRPRVIFAWSKERNAYSFM